MRLVVSINLIVLLVVALFSSGCIPTSGDSVDEQKDPHYLGGRARASSLDYNGAIEEFEKALETNPQSASAHFELGLLYQDRVQNFARAIYHYEQHLRLRPKSEYAETIQQRIKACKSDLVKTEFLAPVNQGLQRDLDRLTSENLQLKQKIQVLEAQLASRPLPPANNPAPQYSQPETRPTNVAPRAGTTTRTETPVTPLPNLATARPKTHAVKSGETVTSIASKYNLKIDTLMRANPKIDPRRLKVGQVLTLPGS